MRKQTDVMYRFHRRFTVPVITTIAAAALAGIAVNFCFMAGEIGWSQTALVVMLEVCAIGCFITESEGDMLPGVGLGFVFVYLVYAQHGLRFLLPLGIVLMAFVIIIVYLALLELTYRLIEDTSVSTPPLSGN